MVCSTKGQNPIRPPKSRFPSPSRCPPPEAFFFEFGPRWECPVALLDFSPPPRRTMCKESRCPPPGHVWSNLPLPEVPPRPVWLNLSGQRHLGKGGVMCDDRWGKVGPSKPLASWSCRIYLPQLHSRHPIDSHNVECYLPMHAEVCSLSKRNKKILLRNLLNLRNGTEAREHLFSFMANHTQTRFLQANAFHYPTKILLEVKQRDHQRSPTPSLSIQRPNNSGTVLPVQLPPFTPEAKLIAVDQVSATCSARPPSFFGEGRACALVCRIFFRAVSWAFLNAPKWCITTSPIFITMLHRHWEG